MKEGWEYKRFNEVFDLQMGKTPDRKTPLYFEGDNVWVSIRDMGAKEISDSSEHISDEAIVASNIHKVKKGTVIMSFKLSVGKCAIAAKDLYTNEAIMAFNLKEGYNVKPDFLYYYLRAYKWTGANKAVMGMTLNKATISQHRLGIPPLSEQQQIVEELDLLSNIIEKKKEQLKELDNLSQSVFYDMFGNIRLEANQLSDFCKVMGGKRIPKGLSFSEEVTKHPYLRATDMKNGTIIKDDIKYIDDNVYEKIKRYTISKDDVYLTNVGVNLGMAGTIPDEFDNANLTENAVKLIFDKSIIDKYFLAAYLNSYIIQHEIKKRKMTVGVPKLAIFRIQTLPFSLPPLTKQQQFALKIEAIEQQKELIKQSIKEVETLFNSRMDYYFN